MRRRVKETEEEEEEEALRLEEEEEKEGVKEKAIDMVVCLAFLPLSYYECLLLPLLLLFDLLLLLQNMNVKFDCDVKKGIN